MASIKAYSTEDRHLVGGSVIAAAEALGLSREQLANAIGVSVPTVARMRSGLPMPGNKSLELSLIFLRIYQSLYCIVGGNTQVMRHWFSMPNKHLTEQAGHSQVPVQVIQRADGLVRVLWYLEHMPRKV